MSGLRAMAEADLEVCHDIDCATSPYPWNRTNLSRGVQKNHVSHVWVDARDRVQGFCICLLVVDELSVLNIAVHPTCQRQGVGRKLMQHALAEGQQAGAQEAFLEVRQSNAAAQALYSDLGFNTIGIRENYYPLPGGRHEHALIMARTLLFD